MEVSRFIPACAGNTAAYTAISAHTSGSSPRVRGTRRARPCASWRPSVHPRVCGEHVRWQRFERALFGSSPRVRGTHLTVSV